MTIEQAIKQSAFANSTEKLMINLLFTTSWLSNKHDDLIKKEGLTNQQYNVLRILRGQKGKAIGVGEITNRMIDKMSNTSRLVDKLEAKELVTRIQCPEDRRAVRITITSKGLDLLSALDPKLQRVQEEITSLNENEMDQLNDLLDKLRT